MVGFMGSSLNAEFQVDSLRTPKRREFGALKTRSTDDLRHRAGIRTPGLNCPGAKGFKSPIWDDPGFIALLVVLAEKSEKVTLTSTNSTSKGFSFHSQPRGKQDFCTVQRACTTSVGELGLVAVVRHPVDFC